MKEIKLYAFSELSEEAQQLAIKKYIDSYPYSHLSMDIEFEFEHLQDYELKENLSETLTHILENNEEYAKTILEVKIRSLSWCPRNGEFDVTYDWQQLLKYGIETHPGLSTHNRNRLLSWANEGYLYIDSIDQRKCGYPNHVFTHLDNPNLCRVEYIGLTHKRVHALLSELEEHLYNVANDAIGYIETYCCEYMESAEEYRMSEEYVTETLENDEEERFYKDGRTI